MALKWTVLVQFAGEVEDFDAPFARDLQVGRLQIPMDHSALMGILQSLGYLGRDGRASSSGMARCGIPLRQSGPLVMRDGLRGHGKAIWP